MSATTSSGASGADARGRAAHQRRRGALGQRVGDEIVAVEVRPRERDEEIARLRACGCRSRRRWRASRAAARPPVAASASAAVHSARHRADLRQRPRARTSASLKGSTVAPTIWPLLVSLAGDQQQIARREQIDRGADGFGAVADLAAPWAGGEDGAADRGRVLAARIVVGDDDDIGEPRRDRAHHRPLARVAVAAAAEHDDEPAAAMRAQRRERRLERVGRMGVIDDHRRAVGVRGDMLHPPRRARELGERGDRGVARHAGREREAQRRERVHRLEFAHQRQREGVPSRRRLRARSRWPAPSGSAPRRGAARRRARAPKPMTRWPRARQSVASSRPSATSRLSTAVPPARQQLGEQPALGREIGGHVAVIVEMVARQVGEGGGAEREPVEAELVEPVARRLERDMVDAAPAPGAARRGGAPPDRAW